MSTLDQVRGIRTSPKVVVAVSWKLTATVPSEVPPVPSAPVCMAIALRAGTTALSDPPDETVNLLKHKINYS